jgi:hypothetical protein
MELSAAIVETQKKLVPGIPVLLFFRPSGRRRKIWIRRLANAARFSAQREARA